MQVDPFARRISILFFVLAYQVCSILSSGSFSVLLHSYSNPESKAFNGDDCDIWPVSKCDVFFEFCLGLVRGAITDDSQCIGGMTRTMTFNNVKTLSFHQNENLGNGLRNPLIINFDNWKGFFTLRIRVWDEDELSKADLVDMFTISNNLHPSSHESTQYITQDLCDATSCLKLGYKLQCDYLHYGDNCSLLCHSTEDHGCENKSKIICPNGRYGDNCTQVCTPRNDSNAGYECSDDGHMICLPRWFGTLCNETCVSNDDEMGHFHCDPATGKKICHAFWCGARCDIECSNLVTSSFAFVQPSSKQNSRSQSSTLLHRVSNIILTSLDSTPTQRMNHYTTVAIPTTLIDKTIITSHSSKKQSTVFSQRLDNSTGKMVSSGHGGNLSFVWMNCLLGVAIFSPMVLIILVVAYRKSKYPRTRIRKFRRHLSSLSITGKEVMWLKKVAQAKKNPKVGRKYSSLALQDLEDEQVTT